MNASVTLLACQIDIPFMTGGDERDAHIDRIATAIDTTLKTQGSVDLVVLPELSTLHYSRACFDHLASLAEPLDESPTLARLGKVARDHAAAILVGMARRDDAGDNAGAFYISQVLINPDGSPGPYYDKLHIAQFGDSTEKDYFSRGDHAMVFELNGFTFGTIICYDIRIPEFSRSLTRDHQIDVLLHPTAFYRDETFYTWHAFAQTRAVENQVYFASVNRAGDDYGSSVLAEPWVDQTRPPAVLGREETFARWVLDRETISDARAHYPFLKDLRDDGGSSQPYPPKTRSTNQ